jgi:hypothetical protein
MTKDKNPPKDPLDDVDFNDLKPHPVAAEFFQPMPNEDIKSLSEDIKAHGLCEPITIHEGQILDGNNRYTACRMAPYSLRKEHFVLFPVDNDPLIFVLSKNAHRRHLDAEGKRRLIAKLLEKRPGASNRLIASIARVSHNTVEAVRQKLEPPPADPPAENPTGQIDQLTGPTPPAPAVTTTRTGLDGKTRTITNPQALGVRALKPLKAIKLNLELITDTASQQEIFNILYDKAGDKKIRKWTQMKEDEAEAKSKSSLEAPASPPN